MQIILNSLYKKTLNHLKILFKRHCSSNKISSSELNTSKHEILGDKNEEKEYKITGMEGHEVAIKSIEAKNCEE